MNFVAFNLAILMAPFVLGVSYYFRKQIYKQAIFVRSFFLLLALLTILFQTNIGDYVIRSGHLGLSFLLIVIFLGVLDPSSHLKKQMTVIRGELAIFGFILIIPHGLSRVNLALTGYQMTGLFAMILLIPLVITSFMNVRKKIKPRIWKKIHYLAYITYILIYIHLGFYLSLNLNQPYLLLNRSAYVYHALALIYLVLKWMQYQKRKSAKKA